jgi:hypothetical protein
MTFACNDAHRQLTTEELKKVNISLSRKLINATLGLGILLASLSSSASNEALMDLLELLHQKGTLTSSEMEILRNAAAADEEKATAATAQATSNVEKKVAAIETKSKKSEWTEKVRLKGDLRARYQYQDIDEGTDRSRGRIRYRLGVIAKPIDNWEVGAGLASGGADQRSTNQSFDGSFSTKNINLDYAYAQYKMGNGVKAIAGKFKRKKYLWAPTDIMWDGDINPEGLGINYSTKNAVGSAFVNTGIWVLEENSRSEDDSYMSYGQLGQKWENGGWKGTLAGTVYSFSDINFVDDLSAHEGTNTDSKLSSFNLAGELGTKVGGGSWKVIGEYINNFETNTADDTAWAAGMKYKKDKWAFKYIYADIDANSVPDFLPDSDRFDGLTDVKGHEVEVKYALNKKVTLALDFYAMEDKATNINQEVLQADVIVKF